MLRRLLFVAPLAALACERPTAPEARDVAARVERQLGRGEVQAVWNALALSGPAAYLPHNEQFREHAVTLVTRDGHSQEVHGFVLENVFVPPSGMGRPISRRSFVAWPDNFAFAVIAMTEGRPGVVGRELLFPDPPDRLVAPTFLRVADYRPRKSWLSREGTVAVDDASVDRPCETGYERTGGFDMPEQGVRCDWMLYRVRVDGEFVVAADTAASTRRAPSHRLDVPDQLVPGVRFITTCPEMPDSVRRSGMRHPCWDHVEGYWRDNALFARDLGVDVTAMTRLNGYFFARDVSRDPDSLSRGWVERWRIYAPDGRMLEADSIGSDVPQPWRRDPDDVLNRLGTLSPSARRQALVPARALFPGASAFSVVILEVEYAAAK